MHSGIVTEIGQRVLLQTGRVWIPVLGFLSRFLVGSHTVRSEGLQVTVIGDYEWGPRQLAAAEEALSWLSADSPRSSEERDLIHENLKKLMVLDPELNRHGTRIVAPAKAVLICHKADETEDAQRLFSLMLRYARCIRERRGTADHTSDRH